MSFTTSDLHFTDMPDNRIGVTCDIGEVVRKITKQIVEAEEGAIEGILERAFHAGWLNGFDIGIGRSDDLMAPDFPEWLTALKKEMAPDVPGV